LYSAIKSEDSEALDSGTSQWCSVSDVSRQTVPWCWRGDTDTRLP